MIPLAGLIAAASTTSTTVAAHASKSSGSILDPIAKPIAGLLAAIYSVIPNYGVAILVLSVIWMIIIAPLTLKSTRSMLAMQKLQPQLKKLQEKHKDDRQAFAQAQMDLFREHQVSPFGACLPTLLPFPVFIALYRVISGLSHKAIVNGVVTYHPKYLSQSTRMFKDIVAGHGRLNAFGLDLSQKAFSHHSSFATALPFWILLLVLAGTGYLQSAQMMSRNPAAQQNPQMRLMKYLPLFFTVIFINFPAGVLLYYSMTNICRIAQQDLMYRFDPKVKRLVAQEVQEVEAMTHDIDERDKSGGTATKPAAAGKPGNANGGRSRFRDLLASAAEDQKARDAKKKPTSGAPPARSGGTPRSGGQNGNSPKGSTPNGSGTNRNKAGSGSHRTNRKRRRR